MLKVCFISLGCPKNLVDSEIMVALVKKAGYEVVAAEALADIIVINTCAFIDSAKEEAINTILEAAEYKKSNCKRIVVTGCLAERYRDEILKELPEVDAIVGVNSFYDIVAAIEGETRIIAPPEKECVEGFERVIATPPYTAYLKIAEGCDNKCTYCAIPSIRGPYRSRRMENIIEEAKKLYKDGVKEVILIAQDTTYYGTDIYGKPMLSELLNKISEIGFTWVRVLYTYPELIDDELLDTVANHENIVKYFDIPIQHISSAVLKRMGRKSTEESIYALIEKIKKKIPDVTLRTSLIVGFSGETEEDFEKLCLFVKTAEFDRLGVFEYSREEGTPAYRLKDIVDDETKAYRRNLIMDIQSRVSYQKNLKKTGKEITVLCEGVQDGYAYARSCADAPDVDGLVYFKSDSAKPGDFIKVKITAAEEYDLTGEQL